MRKVFLTVILTLLFAFTYVTLAQAKTTKLYYDGEWHDYKALPIFLRVNGQDVDGKMPPIVFGEHSLVPAREIFEGLGSTVNWNGAQKQVVVTNENKVIVLTINNETAQVNGEDKQLDIAPKIINDKTMIPTRFVSEQLGLKVDWAEKERTIYISHKPKDIDILAIKYKRNPIKEVAYTEDNGQVVQIDIQSSDEISKYNTMTLEDPYRIIFDIEDAVLKMDNKLIPIGENGIEQIRVSQNTVSPNKTRVVLDLQKKLPHKAYLSEDKKHLLVDIIINDSVLRTGEYLVVIDPGHGGHDPGAIYSGVQEKSLNISIATALKKLLEKEKIKVIMTREDDTFVDLYDRSGLANSVNADLLISIHNNAMDDKSYDGTMTLYNPDDRIGFNNKRFAQIIQEEVVKELKTTDRGLRERPNLAVLRTSEVPAVLVEVAFMTNADDMKNLKTNSFLQKSAEALKDGIIRALNEKSNQ